MGGAQVDRHTINHARANRHAHGYSRTRNQPRTAPCARAGMPAWLQGRDTLCCARTKKRTREAQRIMPARPGRQARGGGSAERARRAGSAGAHARARASRQARERVPARVGQRVERVQAPLKARRGRAQQQAAAVQRKVGRVQRGRLLACAPRALRARRARAAAARSAGACGGAGRARAQATQAVRPQFPIMPRDQPPPPPGLSGRCCRLHVLGNRTHAGHMRRAPWPQTPPAWPPACLPTESQTCSALRRCGRRGCAHRRTRPTRSVRAAATARPRRAPQPPPSRPPGSCCRPRAPPAPALAI